MHLTISPVGVAFDGAGWHPSAWRDLDELANEVFYPSYWNRLAVAADEGGLDYLSIDDSLSLQGSLKERESVSLEAPRADPGIVSGRLDAA